MTRDDELKAAVDRAALIMLGKVLDTAETTDESGRVRQDWDKRRAAAVAICKRAGIADMLRAISADGVLRPPPAWPEADIVPVGGGIGFLDCEVRTLHPRMGIVAAPVRLPLPAGRKPSQDMIGQAFARGKWTLARLILG